MKIALIILRNKSEDGRSFYDYSFISRFLFTNKYFSYLLAIPTIAGLHNLKGALRVPDISPPV